MQDQLLGYLLNALEPSEHELVEQQLATDRQLQQKLELLRNSFEPLESDPDICHPPEGLAHRTCGFVTRQVEMVTVASRSALTSSRSAAAATANYLNPTHWRLLDWVVASGILAASVLLFLPALQYSRGNAQIAACADNLRQVGQATANYALTHSNYFPDVPSSGKLAAAGIYAPKLHEAGYLTDSRTVICPASNLAEQGNFQIPCIKSIQEANGSQLAELQRIMGGSYGYHIGHLNDGKLQKTLNKNRANFALMSDAPSAHLAQHFSVNHGAGGQNVLMENGVVKYMTSCQIGESSDDFFTNDNGQVAPGLNADDSVICYSSLMPVVSSNTAHDEQ